MAGGKSEERIRNGFKETFDGNFIRTEMTSRFVDADKSSARKRFTGQIIAVRTRSKVVPFVTPEIVARLFQVSWKGMVAERQLPTDPFFRPGN